MSLKGLLKCQISDGLFPQEKAVSFKTAQGEQIELFAPNNLIKDDKLEVTILEQNNSLTLIRLPASPTNTTPVVAVAAELTTVSQSN